MLLYETGSSWVYIHKNPDKVEKLEKIKMTNKFTKTLATLILAIPFLPGCGTSKPDYKTDMNYEQIMTNQGGRISGPGGNSPLQGCGTSKPDYKTDMNYEQIMTNQGGRISGPAGNSPQYK